MLVSLELVGVARYQNIAVQLSAWVQLIFKILNYVLGSLIPVDESQGLLVAPGYHLVTVADTDPELANGDHFLLGIVEVLVKVPSHYVDIAGQGFQVIQGFLGAQISRAENVLDTPRNQQLLKFCRKSGGSVRDVKISKDQNQHFV